MEMEIVIHQMFILITDKSLETSGKYLYRLKQIDINGAFVYSGEVEANLGSTQNFELEQNYPNPFNPSTVIKYQIPIDGLVTLKIYDVLGREVTTLVNEHKNTGSYDVTFNASKLASGVYLYQLKVNEYMSTKKLSILK